jgi:Prokaryotic cytochrome b561
MSTRTIAMNQRKTSQVSPAVYEHPFIVRLCHWVNAVALFVLAGSGLQIFRAFPSFGSKIPQRDLLHWPKALAIGGWLGGALQWHLTFMWIYIATGVVYIAYECLSGKYKQILFVSRDIPGVWPMVHHYFFFGPKPPVKETYKPASETCLHHRNCTRNFFGADRISHLEARAVFVVGNPDGRLSLRAPVAFRNHVGPARVRVRASGDGCCAWVEQLRLHVYGVEKRSRVLGRIAVSQSSVHSFMTRADAESSSSTGSVRRTNR